MLQVLVLICLHPTSFCKNARKTQMSCPIVTVLNLASSFSLVYFHNWNGRPPQMTPPATIFFYLHMFSRAENHKIKPSVYRVSSIYKSLLRTTEFIKIVSPLWKLANYNKPFFFLILSFQNLLPVQILQYFQDDTLYQKYTQLGFGEYAQIMNADVSKTEHYFFCRLMFRRVKFK